MMEFKLPGGAFMGGHCGVQEAAEAFDIAEAQTFGLPLFDFQGGK